MKFIGQHIFDSVAKFRGNYGSNDLGKSGPAVEIQGDDSSFITLATNTTLNTPGAWLEMDSGSNDGPYLDIINRDTDANPSYLRFFKRAEMASANDKIGEINFKAYHDGAQSNFGDDFAQGISGLFSYAAIVGEVANPGEGTSYGKLHLGVRAASGQPGSTTVISGVGAGNNIINVDIAHGSSSVTTIAGDLTISGSDFTFDSVALTGIQTSGESFSDDDVSLMTSAAIDDRINTAVATTVGGSVDLASEVSGVLPVANGGTGASSLTDNKLLTGTGTSAVVAEANATYDGTDLTLTSGTSAKPELTIQNSNTDAVGSILKFEKTATGANNDKIGKIQFQADDNADSSITFAEIEGSILSANATGSAQAGQLQLQIRQAGSLANVIKANTLGFGTHLEFADGGLMPYITFKAAVVNFESATSTAPIFSIENQTDDANGPQLMFIKNRTTNPGSSDGDECGRITFRGFDSGNTSTDYAEFYGSAVETDASNECGKAQLLVMADGQSTLRNAITGTGHTTVDKVDIDLGYGAASNTTVAGDLTVTTGLILDSVDITTIQTSGESFADNDTSLMTSAAIDDRINAAGGGGGGSSKIHITWQDPQSYLFYLFNNNSWYSTGSSTLALLGTGSSPSDISSSNSEYGARIAIYTAIAACTVNKLTFNWYWSSSALSGTKAFEFAFSKFTPQNGSLGTITMNSITATDNDGDYTEFVPYQETFTFSGGNATLAAGDSIAMHMRTTDGSSSQRVLVYGTITLEAELS